MRLEFAFVDVFAEFFAQFGHLRGEPGVVHVVVEADAEAAQDGGVDRVFQFHFHVGVFAHRLAYGVQGGAVGVDGGDQLGEYDIMVAAV